MLVNVYDFDKTIYRHDSGVDFYFFSLKKHPFKVLKSTFKTVPSLILYLFKKRSTLDLKDTILYFINEVDLKKLVNDFWDTHEKYINNWYKKQKRKDDVIVSANTDFLLKEICKRLGIKNMIATTYDFKKKKHVGLHCKNKNKITMFYEKYPKYKMNKTYSDSKHDIPLLEEGKEAYVVKGEKLIKYYKGYFK